MFDHHPIQEYVFRDQVGGYPMENLIYPSSLDTFIGGSNDIGTKRFENLIIPAGLFCAVTPIRTGSPCTEAKTKAIEVIDVEMFDRLFESILKSKSKPGTRKSREPISNRTQKKQ